ncbi:MAG: hypothetical protein MJ162_05730 [Treponema sp.]|nr:hypothetical protein [Treponema sp.]
MEEDNKNFTGQLEAALALKKEWLNSDLLQDTLNQYRLVYTCVKNMSEIFQKKSLIVPDPYKFDQKISDIGTVETEAFADNETDKVLGYRLSKYEMIMDYICTYFRFSVDTLTISKVKVFLEFNNTFDWKNISSSSITPNNKALGEVVNQARMNSPTVTISTLNDCLAKCADSMTKINRQLAELIDFQREMYKGRIRKDVIEHPDFDMNKAMSSPDAELAEIKKVYAKVIGKKNFYTDLIQEIIDEDQAPNKADLQSRLLNKLQIKQTNTKKAKVGPDPKFLLLGAISALGAIAPTLNQLHQKVTENFEILFEPKKSFGAALANFFKKILGLKDADHIVSLTIEDQKTGQKHTQKIQVNPFLEDIAKKVRNYSGLMTKGPEYKKIEAASEELVLSFLNKQISDNQSLFTVLNALDEHFKKNVDILKKYRVKGLKIDLASYRNSIINVNKKRGEYVSYKEELEQMNKLGIGKVNE